MRTAIICYLLGCLTPFALWIGYATVSDLVVWILFKRHEPKKGTWVVHSHTNGGTPYSNGGNYSIYRCGFGSSERAVWDPPMRTEEEALRECEKRNSL